jgi:hypothetical protein
MFMLRTNILLGLVIMLATALAFPKSVQSQTEDSKKPEPTATGTKNDTAESEKLEANATKTSLPSETKDKIEDTKKPESDVIKTDFPSEAKNDIDDSAKPEPSKIDSALEAKNNAELKLANKLYNTKKFSEALKHFRTVADSGADNGEARIQAGVCLYQMKNYDAAVKEYMRAAKEGKLISIKRKAEDSARILDCYMRGICPGNCLKRSSPGWHKMPGDNLHIWMTFRYTDHRSGRSGSKSFSNAHMGDVIVFENGVPEDKGKCPLCHGTGHVSLPQ